MQKMTGLYSLRSKFPLEFLTSENVHRHRDRMSPFLTHLGLTYSGTQRQTFLSGSRADGLFLPSYIARDSTGERCEQPDSDFLGVEFNRKIYPTADYTDPRWHFHEEDGVPSPKPFVYVLNQDPCHVGFTQVNKLEFDPAASMCAISRMKPRTDSVIFTKEKDSPVERHRNDTLKLVDEVTAFPLLSWPEGLTDILTRLHASGWPGSQLSAELAEARLVLVRKAHSSSPDPESEYRFSFSFLEEILARSLPQCVIYAFCIAKLVLKEHPCLKDMYKTTIKSYHLKTVLFTLLEETPMEGWETRTDEHNVLFILAKLQSVFQEQSLPNFFVKGLIVFDGVLSEDLEEAAKHLKKMCAAFGTSIACLHNNVTFQDFSKADTAQVSALEATKLTFKPNSTRHQVESAVQTLREAAKQFPASVVIATERLVALAFLKRYGEAEAAIALHDAGVADERMRRTEPCDRICRKRCLPGEIGLLHSWMRDELIRCPHMGVLCSILVKYIETVHIHPRRPEGELKIRRSAVLLKHTKDWLEKDQDHYEYIAKERRQLAQRCPEAAKEKKVRFLCRSIMVGFRAFQLRCLGEHRLALRAFCLAFRLFPHPHMLAACFREAVACTGRL